MAKSNYTAVVIPELKAGVSCWAGHCCGSHVSQFGRITDRFSPLVACIAPSDTMKVGSQRGSDTSTSIPRCSVRLY